MWRAYMTTMVREAATQMLAGSVGTYVTVLQAQSNRFRSRMQRLSVSQGLYLPKGIPWLRTSQRLRVITRPSLLSLVSWRKDRGSTCEVKGINVRCPAVKISPHMNFCSLFWVPVPNHQVGGHNGVCEALAKRLEHVLGRFGSLGLDG